MRVDMGEAKAGRKIAQTFGSKKEKKHMKEKKYIQHIIPTNK